MKKYIITLFIILTSIILISCEENYIDVNQDNMDIFIKHKDGNIGDVMPFYDNGEWNFFYLHDTPPKPGFHPWYRFSTKDFYNFTDHGEVVPVIHDTTSQELALGTGSVIEKDGIYYAFYTAHNGNLSPKETFRLSISKDGMETWEKQEDFEIRPDDEKYDFNHNDFRDPHVVFIPEKKKYYMLFTTRHRGKGAVGYLTSDDLLNWEKEGDGIFFLNNTVNGTNDTSSNLECPTLILFNGTWYLTFSDQWPDRTTHYVYSDSIDGEFIKPSLNIFDGSGLYAGKLGASEDKLMLMGWVSDDFNRDVEFGWGGNFIAHDLKQKSNGELYVDIVDTIDSKVSNLQKLEVIENNVNVNNKNEFNFKGEEEYVIFDDLTGINKITGTLNINELNNDFGIMFDASKNFSSYYYSLSKANRLMTFNRGNIFTKENEHIYTKNDLYLLEDKINFTILFEERKEAAGSIVTIYFEDQMALTGRMFRLSDTNFGFYSNNNDIKITNLKLYK